MFIDCGTKKTPKVTDLSHRTFLEGSERQPEVTDELFVVGGRTGGSEGVVVGRTGSKTISSKHPSSTPNKPTI